MTSATPSPTVVLGVDSRLLDRPGTGWRRSIAYLLAALLWIGPAAAANDRAVLDVQAINAAQSRLLSQATDAVAPHRQGAANLYFLGFAGWAEQDVFLKEGRFVRQLLDMRFGTKGRSMLLANNPESAAELPIASVINLDVALHRLARKMDVENDILFLFLTSHGGPDGLAVRFPPLPLDGLAPARLREILDGTGIRWRVIVVSACYSGSFIDALEDDHTLVMTAARRDRSSFGCTSEADFTYFGDAYFAKGLETTRSFITAFDRARAAIAKREATEHLLPSEPQIAIGEAIRPKLASFEQQLAALPAGTP
jgi:hypothetical protein